MAEEFELHFPGSPTDFLAALQRYGREWRESRIPPRLREAGVYRCAVVIRGGSFELRLNPVHRGPRVLCEGRVLAGPRGTRVVAHARLTTATKILDAVFLGGLTLALGSLAVTGPPDAITTAALFWVYAMVFLGGATVVTAHRELAWHSAAYPEVLARVAGASAVDAGPRPT